MKIVLVHPQIPQNTGNIIRTCVAVGASLALVPPYGFSISDRYMKRAGLDYVPSFPIEEIDDIEKYLENSSSFFLFSSKGKVAYTDVTYQKDSMLIFGSETTGIPEKIMEKWADRLVTIPMEQECRCLNLSNACAIAAYEMRRQVLPFSCKNRGK